MRGGGEGALEGLVRGNLGLGAWKSKSVHASWKPFAAEVVFVRFWRWTLEIPAHQSRPRIYMKGPALSQRPLNDVVGP